MSSNPSTSLSRRGALKAGLAATALAAGLGPRRASAAGTVNFLGWQGYDDPVTFDDFTKSKDITTVLDAVG